VAESSSPSAEQADFVSPGEASGRDRHAWHAAEIDAVAEALGTSPENGLSQVEAERRLAEHGPNELREAPRPGWLHLLLGQFRNFIVLLLIAAAVVSILLGDYLEGLAILAIVLLNAARVIQERAEEALAARRLSARDQVVRDGHRQSLPARSLVPGTSWLEAGNHAPADLR
jgi:Ca2+-transporting ATPase